jgi:hypothetical protein
VASRTNDMTDLQKNYSRATHRFHGPPDKFSVRAPQTFSAHRSVSIFVVKLLSIVRGLKSLFLRFIFHYFKFKNLNSFYGKVSLTKLAIHMTAHHRQVGRNFKLEKITSE